MSTWIVNFIGEPSLRNSPQRRKSLVGRASLHPAQLQIADPYLSGVRIEKHAAITAQPIFPASELKTVQVHILQPRATCNIAWSCAMLVSLGTSSRRQINGLTPRSTARS